LRVAFPVLLFPSLGGAGVRGAGCPPSVVATVVAWRAVCELCEVLGNIWRPAYS